jgi:hypothetical protein
MWDRKDKGSDDTNKVWEISIQNMTLIATLSLNAKNDQANGNTYAVNWFRRFSRKLKNRISGTVLKYDVFLTYIHFKG